MEEVYHKSPLLDGCNCHRGQWGHARGYDKTNNYITREYLLFLGYTEALIEMLLLEYEEDQGSLKNSIEDVRESMPAPLAASFEKPCKETAVQEYVSRFAQR